jgi:hypothetical protein
MSPGGEGRKFPAWKATLIVAGGVAFAALQVWIKVEMGAAARQLEQVERGRERLGEERIKLLAAIDAKNTPGYISKIAAEKLGMVHPDGHRQIEIEGKVQ